VQREYIVDHLNSSTRAPLQAALDNLFGAY
jgi:hypothetical protein